MYERKFPSTYIQVRAAKTLFKLCSRCELMTWDYVYVLNSNNIIPNWWNGIMLYNTNNTIILYIHFA